MLQSPFHKLLKSTEKKFTIVLLILIVVLINVMRYFDAQIQHSGNFQGIISFEFAKDLSASITILNSWDTLAKTAAGLSMGFDFLFLIVYALFISILIHQINNILGKHSKFYTLGIILIWGVFLAAFFDLIENFALIKLLLGDLQQLWSSIAYYSAISKFSLLSLGILFILINSILLVFRKNN
jgi:hypothetical protein